MKAKLTRLKSGILACALGMLLTLPLQGQRPAVLRGIDLPRLTRMRPLPPFDRDMGYMLLDRWSVPDSTATRSASPLMDVLERITLGQELRLGYQWSLYLDGLVHICPQMNDVDGAWLGYEVIGAYHPRPGYRLVLRSAHYYTTKLRQYMSENTALYFYAPERSGLVVASGGFTSGETTPLSNEERLAPTHIATIGTTSSLKHYRRTYLSLRNSIQLGKLRTEVLGVYEYRKAQPLATLDHRALVGEASLHYDLARRAPLSATYPDALQRPRGYFAPEIGLRYRTAIAPTSDGVTYSQYSLMELSLRTAYAWSDTDKLYLGAVAGAYLDRGRVYDADERYLPLSSGVDRLGITGTWTTLPEGFYSGDRWAWGYTDYEMGRRMLGRLISLPLDEALHARLHLGAGHRHWAELGYSIGLGEMLRLGVFVGSDLAGAYTPALRLSVPFFLLSSYASTRYR